MNTICPVSEVYFLLIQQQQDNHSVIHLNDWKYFCKYYWAKQHKLMNFQSQQQTAFLMEKLTKGFKILAALANGWVYRILTGDINSLN